MIPSDASARLLQLLKGKCLDYTIQDNGTITVLHGLVVHGEDLTELPKSLLVHLGLRMKNTGITALPDGLVVKGHLHIDTCPIFCLPSCLSVGKDIKLARTNVTSLPENLHVRGSLDLRHNPMQALPEGLSVGMHLNVQDTGLVRLPEHMTVKGTIIPSQDLEDLHAFMRGRPDRVVVATPTSFHQKIHLLPYPDLYRVIMAMTEGQGLHIQRRPDGTISTEFVH